mgnify:CR=1 FL=1
MDNQQLASEYSDDEYSMTQQEPVYEYHDDDYQDYPEDIDDNESDASSVSYVLVGKKKKTKIKKKKSKQKQDTGIRKIKNANGTLVYFASSILPGAPIRDAVYGTYIHEHRVGSLDEDLYLKVAFAGIGCKGDVDTLFYDNPDQCENHLNVKLSSDLKNKWVERYQYSLKRKQELDYNSGDVVIR